MGSAGAPRRSTRSPRCDVQPFFNEPLTKTAETDVLPPTYGCIFTTTSKKSSLQIIAASGQIAERYYTDSASAGGKPGVALSGVGDKAIRTAGDVWVSAMKSGVFCQIHGDHSADRAENAVADEMRGINISDVRAGNIPDAEAQAVAQQLGTLCNKIYGSGNMTPSFAGLH